MFFIYFIFFGISIKKSENGWTCSLTGSKKGYSEWVFGIISNEYYQKSPIESWLENKKKTVDHNWIRTVGTFFDGWSILRSHSRAPAIYQFLYDSQISFLEEATEKEIEEFLLILKTGNEEEQSKAITAIYKNF